MSSTKKRGVWASIEVVISYVVHAIAKHFFP
jgi:hypothetical protein